MVVEDHEMNIRLEMFFVQFDSLVDSMSPLLLFLFYFFPPTLLSHSATVVFPIPQDYWTTYKTE